MPGEANGVIVANTTSAIALVGPETWCHDEPQSAATTAGSIAQYRPNCGGRPASVAYATPCGSTTSAPMRPARTSACSDRTRDAVAPDEERKDLQRERRHGGVQTLPFQGTTSRST